MENNVMNETIGTRPMTAKEAAAYLGLSQGYLYKLTHFKEIAHYHSQGGKRIYFLLEDLQAWAMGERIEVKKL